MAREQFIESLRIASRLLAPPTVASDLGRQFETSTAAAIHSTDLWLTRKSVEGFDPSDFTDWPAKEREELTEQVAEFLMIAEQVPANKPATKTQSKQGRKCLEGIVHTVGRRLVREWLDAQRAMTSEAMAAADAKGWHAQLDEKEILESLLGRYKAPRLWIRTPDGEFVLDPVARFGSGRQGVVDLVVLPTYETAYLVAFKNGQWQIVASRGSAHRRPFTQATLVNTINALSHP